MFSRSVFRIAVCFSMLMAGCTGRSPGADGGDARRSDSDAASASGDSARVDTGPDSGGCGLVTCASARATCGMVGDGCGGVIECGTCTAPETCGGGGTPSVCGGTSVCTPRTCAMAGANCGPVSDGCGGLLMCGTCTAPQTCGGAGVPSVCGAGGGMDGGTCVARTCAGLGANCGWAANGCGGLLNCGTCTAPALCGGGGSANVCGGATACRPRTCAMVGANCGPVADGCGGLLSCGICTAPQSCGGGGAPSACGVPASSGDAGVPCVNLCLRQVACPGGATATTTVSGTVVAPTQPAFGTPDPLYNALVYIPNAPVMPFTAGVSCDRCGASVSGSPLISAVTGPDGRFTLRNVPIGTNVPLVIQLGRWRRQVVIPNVTRCVDNPLPLALTRLPRNRTEGDIPLMAMVTGNVDALECVLRKIGIDDSEFTTPAGGGRVQLYVANGANAGGGTPAATTLTTSPATLARYDMALFSCEGMQNNKPVPQQQNVIDYANIGGRVFATHFSYTWLYNIAPWSGAARWMVNQGRPPDPLTGIVDTTFPRGLAFSQWLTIVGASTTPGQVRLNQTRHDVDAVVAPTQRWISSTGPTTIQHLTFNTPVGTPAAAQCGRVLFSDFHVNNASSGGMTFPRHCATAPLTPQEKVLEFMLFDLASCITPDMPPPPGCVPRTCAMAGATCGPIGDGCGGMVNCGACVAPDTCGGGGTPSACGRPMCTPRSCASQGLSCGPAGDGCGGMINCGVCVAPDTCGGGGTPGACGRSSCVPRSCAAQGLNCGPAGDGCGGVINCGPCVAPDTCGGGGMPGVCGRGTCTPRTCMAAGANCGALGDGCGAILDCGSCVLPDLCGGAGVANRCGAPPG